MSTKTVTGFWAFVLFAVVIAVALGLGLVFIALAVGTANSWILQGNFTDGWNAVWGRWLIALGWGILFGGGGSSTVAASRR